MNRTIRILLVVVVGFAAALLLIWSVDHFIVQPAFQRLERAQAEEDCARARGAVERELHQLGNLIGDWANWDDTCAFAETRNPEYIRSNLADRDQLERDSHLNLIYFYDNAGTLLYGGTFDSDLGGALDLPAFSGTSPFILPTLRPVFRNHQPVEGILRTDFGPLLMIARPILSTGGQGPPRGVVVFGRFLDAALVRSLAQQAHLSFELFPSGDRRLSREEQALLARVVPGNPRIGTGQDGTAFLYDVLLDLNGHPVAALRVAVRGDIAATARSTSRMLMGVLGLAAVILLLAGAYVFSRARGEPAAHLGAAGWGTLVLAALIGVTLSTGAFLEMRRHSRATLEDLFRNRATERARGISQRFVGALHSLMSVRRAVNILGEIDEHAFTQFNTPLLFERGFRFIAWAPRVSRAEREGYEARALTEGAPQPAVTARQPGSGFGPAPPRDEHFPLRFINPVSGFDLLTGFDLVSDPDIRAAVERCAGTGLAAVTGHVAWLPETASADLMILVPVYGSDPRRMVPADRRRNLKGLVVGALELQNLFRNDNEPAPPPELNACLLDLSAEGRPRVLFRDRYRQQPPEGAESSRLVSSTDLPYAGRLWRLVILPEAAFIERNDRGMHWWALAVGLPLTALVLLYLQALLSQRRRAEAQIRARTRDLLASEQRYREITTRQENQQKAVAAIAVSPFIPTGQLSPLAREITEKASVTCGVERVSIWLFDETETRLVCLDLFEASPCRHTSGRTLSEHEFRAEFAALKTTSYVDANDPLSDPRTAGYVEGYLKPNRITSMLDVVIRSAGRNLGALCLEHVDCPHHWEPDEVAFACQLADQVAIAIANAARLRSEEARKDLEERLLRVEKMESLGLLAGGVAHDLNNVLGVLVGYSELLLMDIPPDSPLREHVSNIMGAGERAAAIVTDLLTLARRGVGTRYVVNLNETVTAFLKTPEFSKLCSFHPRVDVSTDLDGDLLRVLGSPVHLGKTLMNLVSNGAEAMPLGGRLVIRTRNRYLDRPLSGYDHVVPGDYVVLSVSDTGEGITPENLKRIFEPFYTKKIMGRSGTGLGLSVVWGTVKDHDGYIDVVSSPGEGTTFSLYFPVTRQHGGTDAKPSTESYAGRGESILVVDDIRQQRELASDLLSRLDYRVATVSSGEEAVKYLKQQPVDLVVLDMIMDPGIDGLETYQRILDVRPGQRAVIVSGFAETDRVREAQKLGAGPYIRKPYIQKKLGLAVRAELDRPLRTPAH
ncbi:MAG: CHASE domain-containing protein [Acidobacteria bacterium]|nr:CHASE domain-containing protein [Acidobacteriota bacterium]